MVHAGDCLVSNTLKQRRVFQIGSIVSLGPMSICKGTVSILIRLIGALNVLPLET